MSHHEMSSGRRKLRIAVRILAAVLVLLIGGALYDLFYPRTTHLREFDPNEVARLETAMWRSYYEKQRVRLFNQMTELLRSQYHMTPVKSNVVAYYAAHAAFVFKDGKERADYEKALPDLIKFYSYLHNMSDIDLMFTKLRSSNSNGGSFIVSARSMPRMIWPEPSLNYRPRFIASR
jgi:hypothetical protein